ncbi:hypothetical protein [Oryzisolibacter propanilivorax]|uniref:hypothetical protein n=1 Tax=Oryzisolibacter propanilivorax TaxID=1527607 RepID=UPI0011137A14|nr:hypothetical protein [Oryzisolibacter propanilivorax]
MPPLHKSRGGIDKIMPGAEAAIQFFTQVVDAQSFWLVISEKVPSKIPSNFFAAPFSALAGLLVQRISRQAGRKVAPSARRIVPVAIDWAARQTKAHRHFMKHAAQAHRPQPRHLRKPQFALDVAGVWQTVSIWWFPRGIQQVSTETRV